MERTHAQSKSKSQALRIIALQVKSREEITYFISRKPLLYNVQDPYRKDEDRLSFSLYIFEIFSTRDYSTRRPLPVRNHLRSSSSMRCIIQLHSKPSHSSTYSPKRLKKRSTSFPPPSCSHPTISEEHPSHHQIYALFHATLHCPTAHTIYLHNTPYQSSPAARPQHHSHFPFT